jgi:putative nucleotidyltransferase with HDIG domain
MEYAELVLRIEKTAQLYCEKVADDPSLWNHTSLVREFAMRLAAVENANPKVVEIASLLHDVGKSVDKENHHVTSAQLAKEVLKENGLTEQEK